MIKRFTTRQSELSFATAAIFLVALAVAIFMTLWDPNLVIPAHAWNMVMGLYVLIIAWIFWYGSRLSVAMSVSLVSIVIAILLIFAYVTTSAIHSVVSGLFLPIIGIYLMWFNRKIIARILIASFLSVFSLVMISKYDHKFYLVVFTIVTETLVASEIIRALVDRLQRATLVDSLTKTWNRRGLHRQLKVEVDLANRNQSPLSLLYIDLDDFKIVNDTQGHNAGDQALKDFVQQVSTQIRPRDIFARMGGDEFLLVLPETSQHASEILAQRLQRDSPIAWSYGISQYRVGESFDELLARADTMLLEGKAERKVGR
ncbi:MAG: diguanylate cyclase [Microbacteriaceae bacterium]